LDWELISDKQGVRTWVSEVSGTPFVAVRGSTHLDFPIGHIAGAIIDNDKKPDWVDMLVRSTPVVSDGVTVVYDLYDLPWPVWDRDYVMQREVILRPEAHEVIVRYLSVEDERFPVVESTVRATVDHTLWTLREDASGGTQVELEVLTDPGGAMPIWLVNRIQRKWPRSTLEALEQRLGRPDIVPLAGVSGG